MQVECVSFECFSITYYVNDHTPPCPSPTYICCISSLIELLSDYITPGVPAGSHERHVSCKRPAVDFSNHSQFCCGTVGINHCGCKSTSVGPCERAIIYKNQICIHPMLLTSGCYQEGSTISCHSYWVNKGHSLINNDLREKLLFYWQYYNKTVSWFTIF